MVIFQRKSDSSMIPECEHCFYLCSEGCVLGNDRARCHDFELEDTVFRSRHVKRKIGYC